MDKNRHAEIYFEDWNEGDQFITAGRTVSITDIETYTNNMEDYNPLYTDDEFAKKEMYGSRIAPELLVHAISLGQISQTRLFEETAMGFNKIDIDFINPVKPGDTLTSKVKFIGKEATGKKGCGVVKFYIEVMNQRGEIILKSNQYVAIRKKDV